MSPAPRIELFKPEQWVAAFVLTQQWARQTVIPPPRPAQKRAGAEGWVHGLASDAEGLRRQTSDTPVIVIPGNHNTGRDMGPPPPAPPSLWRRERCWNRTDPIPKPRQPPPDGQSRRFARPPQRAPAAARLFLTIVDPAVSLPICQSAVWRTLAQRR